MCHILLTKASHKGSPDSRSRKLLVESCKMTLYWGNEDRGAIHWSHQYNKYNMYAFIAFKSTNTYILMLEPHYWSAYSLISHKHLSLSIQRLLYIPKTCTSPSPAPVSLSNKWHYSPFIHLSVYYSFFYSLFNSTYIY